MSDDESLPEYATMLAAYHAAFEGELRAMVAGLPIAPGARVLDLACGDGVYSAWLADRVGPEGIVVGVDLSSAFLDVAQSRARLDRVAFVAARLERMPFAEGAFDLVWCAQSLYSLPDPVEALRSLRRMVRPGGVVAVLENDTLHQLLLPWPIEVELAVRRAELAAFVKESDRPRKFYVGRNLLGVFRDAGLVDCRRRTWASDRQAPLSPPLRAFLREYVGDLRERVGPRLEPAMLARLDRLIDPTSEAYLLDAPDFALTSIDHVVWGVKPGADP